MTPEEREAKLKEVDDMVFEGLDVQVGKPAQTNAPKLLNILTLLANQKQGMSNGVPQPQKTVMPQPEIQEPELTPVQIENRKKYGAAFGM